MIGSKLGSYEVEEEIGRGGMGVVYRAHQPNLQRRVAVKVLLPHLAKDADFVERFMREARSAAKLHHPGLVTIFDVGELDGTYFFSMQWLRGKTLEEMLEEPGALPVADVVSVVSQMAAALGYAHEAGVVHRDVKPANVIVDDSGRAVLTDFGIAQAGNQTRLTRVGASVGSPDYMAPEQIQGEAIDARTDLYALGVLFHHLLTGEPPYTGDAPIAVAYQHLNAPVPSVREKRPEVPPALGEVVARMMAKAPEDRFQSADEVLAALQDIPGLEVSGPPTGIGSVPIVVGPDRVAEPVSESPAAAGPLGSTFGRVALAVLAAVVVAGGVYWGLGRDEVDPGVEDTSEAVMGRTSEQQAPKPAATEPGATEPAATEPAPQPFSARVEIRPDMADLEIWLDGRDQGLTTPGDLEVEGNVGDARTVELRRDGEVLASLGLTLGPQMLSSWEPALAPAEETITIWSEPAGARVLLDGATLDGVTPLEVAFVPGRDYQLRLALDGHEPAGWSFDLDELSAEQRESRSLHFVLETSVPPAELVVLASYQVTVAVAGRSRTGEGEVRLPVPPGNHTVRVSAPKVFYDDSLSVVLESDKSFTLRLPDTVTIPVNADGRCWFSIDGREVGEVPEEVELTIGSHMFRFRWEDGPVIERQHTIGKSTKQVREVMP